jgi:hypothetical protein
MGFYVIMLGGMMLSAVIMLILDVLSERQERRRQNR